MVLSPEQLEVVESAIGHILVLSGPGSGKTHTITEKIMYLFQKQVVPEPYGLLAITFTNAASNEMRARLRKKGFSQWGRIRVDTFHGFCRYILSCYGGDVGIREDFDIIELNDQIELLTQISDKHLKGMKPSDLRRAIENFKRRGIYPNIDSGTLPSSIIPAYSEYQQSLAKQNKVDFGDLITLAVQLLQTSNLAQRLFTNYFRYLMVDEFQDTDHQQLELVKIMAEGAIGSTIVADDDQSIYKFRGADRTNVKAIEGILKCKKLILGANFRSDQVIVDAAKSVIEKEPNRDPKKLRATSKDKGRIYKQEFSTPTEEANQVVEWITFLDAEEMISDWGEVAIITRAGWRAEQVLLRLDEERIPWFDRSRLQFHDSWETSLGLAILSLACDIDSSDEYHRVLIAIEDGGLASYLGEQDAVDVTRYIKDKLIRFINFSVEPNKAAKILELSGIEEIIHNNSWSKTDAKRRIQNLEIMVKDISYETEQLNLGLTEIVARLAGIGAVQVMSGHGSKGREFDNVFFIGLEDDVLPSWRAHESEEDISEERRIFYVGLTRARNAAYLTYAKKRINKWGKVIDRNPSRFLESIPPELFSTHTQ